MGGNAHIVTRSGASAHPDGVIGDRSHDSKRATRRRRAAEDALLDALLLPNEAQHDSVGSEGQALLIKSLLRLERQEDVQATVAWTLDPAGKPMVMGAHPAEWASHIQPTPEAYHALATLDRVQRLTDTGLGPALTSLGALGISAAAPVAGLGTTPAAILLVYPNKPGRPLRPRTIAVLAEVASKLTNTLSSSLALERMAQLDGAVQRIDRLAALGGLVSEIVHEIRNPLVSVKTFLQLLPERLDDPEFHHDFRSVVSDEVGRLERMLDDLLRHARPTTPAVIDERARIKDAVGTTLQLLTYRCRERGIELVSNLREELPALGLPQDALRQLLLNLLINATQVTPSGGMIEIRADWSPDNANHVTIWVEDEGPGLGSTLTQRIFEPFWTTRDTGAGGLGLAICKRITEEAGGRISVEDGAKGGARFRVELPIAT
jgi:signal transduction histidine kinase